MPVAEGVLADPAALAILLSGIAIILLLAALVFVLGTGRSRALLLVDERTDQLRHQALHDALTGLPNRALILDRIGQMLAQSRRRATPVAVLFIDLDNFKDINDTLGHRAGDELLVAVAARLETAVREGDTVGRLGGDEFVVLTEGATPDADAAVVADRILEVLSRPLDPGRQRRPAVGERQHRIAEGDRGSPEELLQDADIALYQAKARASTAPCGSRRRCSTPSTITAASRWTCTTHWRTVSSSSSTNPCSISPRVRSRASSPSCGGVIPCEAWCSPTSSYPPWSRPP